MLGHLLLLIFAVIWVGLPIAIWIHRSGERRGDVLILHSFIGGALLLGVGLQGSWKLGFDVHRSWVALLACVSLINFAYFLILRGRLALDWRNVSAAWAFVAVAALMGSVYVTNHGKPYYGRAWGDQLNYSLMANFLQLRSPALPKPPFTQPATLAVVDGGLFEENRIGQSFLHTWTSQITRLPVLESFYLVSVLAVLSIFSAAFLAALTLGLPSSLSAFAAIAIAMAPPSHAIHLESFLSQILVTPIVVYAIVTSFLAATTGQKVWLLTTALCVAWVLATYYHFFPILIVSEAVLLLALVSFRSCKLAPVLGLLLALVAGGCLAIWSANNPFKLMGRSGEQLPEFEKFFPWAYREEGFARLLVGDSVLALPGAGVTFVAISVAALTITGMLGFLIVAVKQKRAIAIALAAAAAVPYGVALLPGEHAYAFYKLLQSFWPLTILGLAAALTLWGGGSWRLRTALVATAALAVMLSVFSLSMLATEAVAFSSRSGLNPYLRIYGEKEMRNLVANRPESKLIINMPNRFVWNDSLANGVAALQLQSDFPEIQSKWVQIGDRAHRQPVNSAIPGDPGFPQVRSIQPEFLELLEDVLVLQIGSSFVLPAPGLFEDIGSYGRMRLLKPIGPDWIVVSSIVPAQHGEFTKDDDGVLVGDTPESFLRLDLESSQELPEGIDIEVRWDPKTGPQPILWHLYSNTGYGNIFEARGSIVVLRSGPLRRGVTEVFFGLRNPGDQSEGKTQQVKIKGITYGI